MPIKGIVFILIVAVIIGIIFRDEMYAWFKNLSNDNKEKEKGETEE